MFVLILVFIFLQFGAGFQSSGLMRGIQPSGNFSSFNSRNPRPFPQYGQVNYQSNAGLWNNYRSRSRENFGRSGEVKAASELTRGPRADNKNSSKSPADVEQLGFANRDKYNLQEFEAVYDCAKFFVIKSYSEDDIHKCIKYDVWSSTPNGNKKLDAAFREADAKTTEAGKKCPVFLFFSVSLCSFIELVQEVSSCCLYWPHIVYLLIVTLLLLVI